MIRLVVRSLAITGRASKNVAVKKNRQDAMRNKLFTRLGVRILMAARSGGGPNPDKNVDLARALKEAQAAKLPKENVERAIAKAGEKNTEDFSAGLYEIFGHGSAAIIVETLTDNPTRAVKTIKEVTRRSVGARFTTGGSVTFNFTQKAVLRAISPFEEDKVLEAAIAADVGECDFAADTSTSDVEDSDAELPQTIVTDTLDKQTLQDAVVKAGIAIRSAELEWLPNSWVQVNSEELEKNSALIESLRELEDVDEVYHNVQGLR